jgi:hypothetical protein
MYLKLPVLAACATLLLASACTPAADLTGPEAAALQVDAVPVTSSEAADNGGMFGNGNRGETATGDNTGSMGSGGHAAPSDGDGAVTTAGNGGMFGNGN